MTGSSLRARATTAQDCLRSGSVWRGSENATQAGERDGDDLAAAERELWLHRQLVAYLRDSGGASSLEQQARA